MIRCICTLVLAAIAFSLAPLPVAADALPSLSMLSLRYRMARAEAVANAGAEAAVVKELATVDEQMREAFRLGRGGEVRRLLARGMALTAGTPFGEAEEFAQSLVARADSAFVDPARPLRVRLEQMFPATIAREGELGVRAALHEAAAFTRGRVERGKKLRDLAARSGIGVGLDLIESPAALEVDVSDVANGDYDVVIELLAGETSLGSAAARIHLRSGLDARVASLRAAAKAAPDAMRAEVLYPLDYMRKVDVGLVPSRGFDVDAELAAAEQVAQLIAAGKSPFDGKTGNFERHYLLAEAGEIMPYRVYVPTTYSADRALPLIVALHGLGGNEDAMLGDFYGIPALAEKHGYLVVAPMGFRIDGGYGGGGQNAAADRRGALSETDVMQVLERMRNDYKVDASRIYLMGHSMGAIGTWRLAAKYPDLWAALGPIAGTGNPESMGAMQHIPQIVVHGDNDRTVPVTGSQGMVEALRKLGGTVEYIEVAGGGHTDIAPANMAKIFAFFDAHRKP